MVTSDSLNQIDPNLPQLQKTSQDTASTALDYSSAQSLLPMKLKQAIMEKLNYNQDIISQQNQAMSNYFAAPSKAREQYQNIFNPFQRESLVSQATANAYAPYATSSDILAQRQGGIADVINAGTGAFQADVTSKQGKATLAEQIYQNALDNAKWMFQQTHQTPTGGLQGLMYQKAQQGLQSDIQSYKPLEYLIKMYSNDIPTSEIVNAYNKFHTGQGGEPWGQAKESASTIQQWAAPPKQPTSGDQRNTAVQDLMGDLQSAQNAPQYQGNSNQLFIDLKKSYPELSDGQIKSLMNAYGFPI
jgi:hypothetical protein